MDTHIHKYSTKFEIISQQMSVELSDEAKIIQKWIFLDKKWRLTLNLSMEYRLWITL
jgi:hypothetical protein